MSGRIDVSFLGKQESLILIKSPKRIYHDATWSTLRDDLVFIGGCVAFALAAYVIGILVFAL